MMMPNSSAVNISLRPTPRAASTRNTESSPREYQRFKTNARPRLCPDCWKKERIFRPITGKTHGMTLRINPPPKANNNATSVDCVATTSSACTRSASKRALPALLAEPAVAPEPCEAVNGPSASDPSAAENGIGVGGRQAFGSHGCTVTLPAIFNLAGSTPAASSIGADQVTESWCVSTVRLSKIGSCFLSGGNDGWKGPVMRTPGGGLTVIVVAIGPPGGCVSE